MANRTFINQQWTLLKGVTTLWARFLVTGTTPALMKWNYPQLGQTGSPANTYTAAPTTGGGLGFPNRYNQGADGVYSVSRTATGLWSVQLSDFYSRLISVTGFQSLAGGAATIVAVAENTTISAMATAANGGSLIGVALLSSTGTLADPATTTSMTLRFDLQNSTAP